MPKSKLTLILLLLLLCSCGGKRELGKVEVAGMKGVFFVLYQYDEFDSATAIHYEIMDENDQIIKAEKFLFGTHDHFESSEGFYANSYDSIIYLTFPSKHEIVAIYDLKDENRLDPVSSPYSENIKERDSLLKILKSQNSNLKFTGVY